MMAGCNGEYEPQQDTQKPVVVDFALTVSKSASPGSSGITRMTSTYIAINANPVVQCAIPFQVANADVPIAIEDHYASEPIVSFNPSHSTLPFFTSSCNFATGVNAVLAYARPNNNNALLKQKGALDITFGGYQPANISFRLKSIQTKDDYLGTEEEKKVPEQIADYLTAIANTSIVTDEVTKTWKDHATTNDLKLLFKNFTNQLADEVGEVLPGSAANVKAWVTTLWTYLNNLMLEEDTDDDKIRDAIIENIEKKLDKTTTPKDWKSDVKTAWDGFPSSLSSIGLPDGAAVVRWDGAKFVPETRTTTVADINNLERITYPAEIYYYGNSPTWVSPNDLSENFKTKDEWSDDADGVLHGFEKGAVDATTKTVAMGDPLQYGVAQLQMTMTSISSLPHAGTTPANIAVGTNNFKLTGIIVGGQLPVGFDFSPETLYPSYSEADMSFIYDSQLGTDPIYLTTSESSAVSTLVLQSYTRRNLKLVLEFENNSDTDFKGLNGTVFKGTKFYLVGEVDYTKFKKNDEIPEDVKTRVFTQDYVTTIAVTVNSLAKAYNVLPNLLSPRLEMGIELTPQWEQATTTDVIL